MSIDQKHWKQPPRIKVYEALGCIGDSRIRVDGNSAEVDSSGNRKTYSVQYYSGNLEDPKSQAIRANDNGSYWQGYLGYPAIAYLCMIGVIQYDKRAAEPLKNIDWKVINTEFKNDYDRVIEYILQDNKEKEIIQQSVESIMKQIQKLHIKKLGKRTKPPK